MTQYNRVPLRRERPQRRTLPPWILGTLIAVFLGGIFLSAYLVFATVRDFVANWKITGSGLATPAVALGQSTAVPAGTGSAADTPAPGASHIPTVVVKSWTGT